MAISFEDSLNKESTSARGATSCASEARIYKTETDDWILDKRYDYYQEYSDNSVSTIDKLKNIELDSSQVCITQETNSQYIPFIMNRYYDNFDLASTLLKIHFVNSNRKEAVDSPINVQYNSEKIKFGWLVDERATLVAGKVSFEIIAVGENDESEEYIWKTKPCHSLSVLASLSGNGTISPDESWETGFLAQVMAHVQIAKTAANAAEAAATRAENVASGVTPGQAVTIDKTLTIEGQAADAKAVGDAIDNIQIIELDTTLSISGMAADSKSVGDKIAELYGDISVILDEINGTVI